MNTIKYKGFVIRSITKDDYIVWVVEMPGELSVISRDIQKVMKSIDSYQNLYISYEDMPTEIEEEVTLPISR